MKVLGNSYCADFRGREYAKRYRLDHREKNVVLPSVGAYELYHGAVEVGRDPSRVNRDLPWVDRVDYDPAHALEAARIRDELEQRGHRLQHPDVIVAGVARSFGVPLVTSDSGFENVEGLAVENPRELYD